MRNSTPFPLDAKLTTPSMELNTGLDATLKTAAFITTSAISHATLKEHQNASIVVTMVTTETTVTSTDNTRLTRTKKQQA